MEYTFDKIFVPHQHSFITREMELQKNTARVHSHKNFELNFILSGSGKRIVGNNISSFEKDDLVLLGPNLPHCWEILQTEDEEPPKCIVIHFYENLISSDFFNKPELEEIVDLLKQAETGIFFSGLEIPTIKHLLQELTQKEGLNSYIGLLQIFSLLLSCEKREFISKAPMKVSGFEQDFEQINKIYEYVFQHIQEEIKLQEVATLLNMAPGSFCRFFKKKTKLTFMEYVIKIRIGFAAKMLAETNKQVTEIGYDCGYNNLANFNHYFKKLMGKTPSEYRKDFR
ncbi:AraC family transcriptional regulator [Mangrovibacterium lignilyticum]|uniref:AraC family transcriptional regulator n=1 Tax=Mangrovibacterium lignilyticum TaxID=2668052 RepID=UPI0013D2D2B5|nr:AraC family transcriptional regulator [Mangrovibacterium lignilyticum]